MRRWPRWSAEQSRGRVWLLLWPAAAVVGLTAEWRLYGWADPGDWAPDLVTGWTMIACGYGKIPVTGKFILADIVVKFNRHTNCKWRTRSILPENGITCGQLNFKAFFIVA